MDALLVAAPVLASRLPTTLKGGFLLGCLVLAGLLVLTHAVTVIWPRKPGPGKGKAGKRELEAAAAEVEQAAQQVQEAAAANQEAAAANLEAATASGASTTAGVHALVSLKSNPRIVDLLGSEEPEALDYLTKVDLDRADAAAKAEKAKGRAEKAGEQAEKAKQEADKVRQKAKAGGSSLLGTVEGISKRMPMVGGAIVLVLLGGMGADLIKFSIG